MTGDIADFLIWFHMIFTGPLAGSFENKDFLKAIFGKIKVFWTED